METQTDAPTPATIDSLIKRYTLMALATGAMPVPAASAAIVAQNAAMIAQIASRSGVPISLASVTASMGFLGSANLIGRTLFIEVAKVLSWGATGGIAAVALCGVGATTAGLQTYILGRLAQDMAGWHGEMPSHAVKSAVAKAKATFTEDVRQWREGRSAA